MNKHNYKALHKEKLHGVDVWNKAMVTCRTCYQTWEFGGKVKMMDDYPIYR